LTGKRTAEAANCRSVFEREEGLQAAALSTVDFHFVGGSHCLLGESPVWDSRRGCLWWVDIEGCRLFCWYPERPRAESWQTPEMPGFVVPTSQGSPALGMESGIFVFEPDNGGFHRIVDQNICGVRFNDATVDGRGRLWAGTMDIEGDEPRGSLYCVAEDLRPVVVMSGLFRPNGLAADDELSRLYLSDSHPRVQSVWTFEFDAERPRLGGRRLFADFCDRPGRPDGAAIDADGNYMIAAINGGCIRMFGPDGNEIGEIATPFFDPTKPAFGGDGLDRLFITSKRDERHSGQVAFIHGTPDRHLRGRPGHCWKIPERVS
jgi:sugar lactone lactonase YvrE